ncbi:MAG TPA: sensor histidine kinase [Polyangiaceae bacterium]|nr:sensor histidine kinase [Polyangiaceae bacterium]
MATPLESRSTDKLAEAHSRFAQAALFIYLGAALLALILLLAAIVTDKSHNDEQAVRQLQLETEVVAHRLADYLSLHVEELQRLGQRAEVNLLDQSLEPERALLDMAHQDSPLFNLGVAIVDRGGQVLWAEPQQFLGDRGSLGARPWFLDVHDRRVARVISPFPKEPVLYVVSPILREERFTGAFIGGLDLTTDRAITAAMRERPYVSTLLATRRGGVVFPPAPPAFTRSADWYSIFQGRSENATTAEVVFDGAEAIVASARVPVADLFLLNAAKKSDLFADSDRRLRVRLLLGVVLALSPMIALVLILSRSLAQFRRSETEAVREEHLRTIGEAANVIAHEVRNSLNGIRMGIDLMLDKHRRPSERVVTELRAEIERLSSFTYQLMLFAKNPDPHRTAVNLSEMVPRWLSLTRDVAAETGVEVQLHGADRPVVVQGDPTLLQIVVGNLVSNALDAVAGVEPPLIVVALAAEDGHAEVRVEDNGPGVEPTFRERLFQPFVTGKPSGVGMGLSISRKIARAHGGDLVLDTTRAGASFLLTLPTEAT